MPKKILIIEDEELLKDMYVQKFKENGFEVKSVETEKETFKVLETFLPDLILLDILLPEKDGVQILKKLKQGETKNIKVLAFSNLDDPHVKKEVKKYKAEGYLIKTDFTPKEIVEKVKKYL